MASKRRLRRRSCSRKKRFASRDLAESAMFRIIRGGRKHGGWLHVYHCNFCGGFHFGHARQGVI